MTSSPSSAESVERLVGNGDDKVQCNQPSRACCAEIQAAPRRPEVERYCTQRQAQHVGHPEADGRVIKRVHIGDLDLEPQLKHRLVVRLLHHLGHRRGLLPFWYYDRDAPWHTIFLIRLAAWAVAPGRARRGFDASCLGIEAWWGILAVAEATQSTAAPEGASRARHCGRCLSGAHGACGALEAHGLTAHAHEAAGRARHTSAQPLRARNHAWAAWRLLRAGCWRKVAHAGLGALIGTGEAGGAGVRALCARQRRAGARRAVRPGLAGDARLLARVGLAAPEATATKPAEQFLQSAGSELPGIGLAFPGAHAWHDALFFWPTSELNVPAGHGVNVCRKLAAPSAEQDPPRGQSLHSVELTFSLSLPAGHVKQRPGRARDATCLHQAGDAEGEVCSGRTQEWLNGRSWAVLAAAVALAAASVVRLLTRVAEVAKCARIRAADEVHWGQGQRRWRDPQAERAVDDGIFP
eukprot:scaffold2392_cov72-Phaeocystis_antarctica.AAC.3